MCTDAGKSHHVCNDFHPEMKFDTALGESGVVCAWYSTDGVLHKLDMGVEYGVMQGGTNDRIAFDIALRRSGEDYTGDMKVLS